MNDQEEFLNIGEYQINLMRRGLINGYNKNTLYACILNRENNKLACDDYFYKKYFDPLNNNQNHKHTTVINNFYDNYVNNNNFILEIYVNDSDCEGLYINKMVYHNEEVSNTVRLHLDIDMSKINYENFFKIEVYLSYVNIGMKHVNREYITDEHRKNILIKLLDNLEEAVNKYENNSILIENINKLLNKLKETKPISRVKSAKTTE